MSRRVKEFVATLTPDECKEVVSELFGEGDPITMIFKWLAGQDANNKKAMHDIGMSIFDKYVGAANVDLPGPDRISKPVARAVWDPVCNNFIVDVCSRA